MGMISFAQNAEDVVLARVLTQRIGFYVDVGAADPDIASVTRHFYDRGWNGINIEPRHDAIDRLNEKRPRDVNIMCAASDHDGTVELFNVLQDPDLTTVDRHWLDNFQDGSYDVERQEVPARPLDSIFEEQGVEVIDFLKIDAEGSEGAVLRGVDLDRWKPRIVVIEAIGPWSRDRRDGEWRSRLEDRGYVERLFDGVNLFFVRDDEHDILDHLGPASVLDDFRSAATVALEEQLRSVEQYVRRLESELDRARTANLEARSYVTALEEQLKRSNGRAGQSRRPIARPSLSRSDHGPSSPAPPPRSARIAIVGTPYSGEAWLRAVLADALGASEIVAAHPADVAWADLPERVIVQLAWHRSAYLEDMLRRHGFVIVSIARHPLDVLVSAYEARTDETGPAIREPLLGNPAKANGKLAGSENGTIPKPRTSVGDAEFRDWVTSAHARWMLSLTPSWWSTPAAHRARFEELQLDPLPRLDRLLTECDLAPSNGLEQVIHAHPLERSIRRTRQLTQEALSFGMEVHRNIASVLTYTDER